MRVLSLTLPGWLILTACHNGSAEKPSTDDGADDAGSSSDGVSEVSAAADIGWEVASEGASDTSTSTSDEGTGCTSANEVPNMPTITQPSSGATAVSPTDVRFVGSAFSDPDSTGAHESTTFELWVASGGTPVSRIWLAELGAVTQASLSDGMFEVDGSVGQLADDTQYGVRVRHSDECNAWSPWSPYVTFRTADASEYIFDPDVIHTFELEIPPESWDNINAEAPAEDCVRIDRNYYAGTLRFQGQEFTGVGVRTKGGCGSARDLGGKAAFKINLNWDDPEVPGCPTKRTLYGLDHITLNNAVQDRSSVHERLTYTFYRAAGNPAPRATHARLNVNGEYWGLYVHVETIDRTFLRRFYDNPRGMMYEGAYSCDLLPENVPTELMGDSCFSLEFQQDMCDGAPKPGEDPQDWGLLETLTNQLEAIPTGQFHQDVQNVFVFDRLLTAWAIDAMVDHWDGYFYDVINNYRVYHDPSNGLWDVIPWGTDQTFDDDRLTVWDPAARVPRRCLSEQTCQDAFAARLYEVIDLYESLFLTQEADRIHELIAPHVMEDPRKEYGMNEHQNAHANTLDFIDGRPQQIRSALANQGY